MKPLEGKIALVTGAARGIGHQCALALYNSGASVIANDLRRIDFLASEIGNWTESNDNRIVINHYDVSNSDEVVKMFEDGRDQLGVPDIVVANAAAEIRAPFLEMPRADYAHVLRTSQDGVFWTCQTAARQMVEAKKEGRIIVIGSVLANIPHASNAAYCSAKAAITQLVRVIALELAPYRITVNCIAPGHIDTPGEHELCTEEELEDSAERIPLKRLGLPEEIARVVQFLALPESGYITRSTITVDGGLSLRLGN